MKVPQKLDYAMRAMVQLALHYNQSQVLRIEELGEAEAIPSQFLAQILGDLRKAGLVKSKRGKQGGYILSSSPASIRYYDIIAAIEGEEFLQHDAKKGGASADIVHNIWKAMNEQLKKECKARTLQDLCDKSQIPMFFI